LALGFRSSLRKFLERSVIQGLLYFDIEEITFMASRTALGGWNMVRILLSNRYALAIVRSENRLHGRQKQEI
jgi:hypothetical protein